MTCCCSCRCSAFAVSFSSIRQTSFASSASFTSSGGYPENSPKYLFSMNFLNWIICPLSFYHTYWRLLQRRQQGILTQFWLIYYRRSQIITPTLFQELERNRQFVAGQSLAIYTRRSLSIFSQAPRRRYCIYILTSRDKATRLYTQFQYIYALQRVAHKCSEAEPEYVKICHYFIVGMEFNQQTQTRIRGMYEQTLFFFPPLPPPLCYLLSLHIKIIHHPYGVLDLRSEKDFQ